MTDRQSSRSRSALQRRFLIPGLLSLLGAPLTAQEPVATSPSVTPDGQTAFQATTELVVLPVNVTDATGNFVSGLTANSFRIYEDGRRQKVALFEREDVPVTVGLIVDHSRSMRPKLLAVTRAISGFAHSSNPQDEMFVVDFSDRVWPELFGGEPFTSDVRLIENAINSVGAEGQTALYDAVFEGLRRLRMGHRNKKALIIVSDGGDNASRRKYGEILALARQSQAVIYAIGLVGKPGEEENPRLLEHLCKDTGGLAFFPQAIDMVGDVSIRIATDLRQQYTLGYAPEKKMKAEEFRKVRVKVSAIGDGKIYVRTRRGYSAAKEQPVFPP